MTIQAPTRPPLETSQPLKLSEAMRLGSMLTKQSFGRWSMVDGGGNLFTCAISAAWYALTGEADANARGSALDDLLNTVRVKHPACEEVMDLGQVLISLNDDYRWPRQRIADWLEGLGL